MSTTNNTNTNNKTNTTMNMNNKEDKNMNKTNITKTDNTMSRIRIAHEFRQGIMMEIIYVDNLPLCAAGFSSEEDKKNLINRIQMIVDNSNKHGYALIQEIREVMMAGAYMSEAQIPQDELPEEVEIGGKKYAISYFNKAAYTLDFQTVVSEIPENLKYLEDKGAIKALLISDIEKKQAEDATEKARRAAEHDREHNRFDDDEPECDGDCYHCPYDKCYR